MNRIWVEFLQQSEWGLRLLLALVLGGIIGWERERKALPAGLRTYMLVSLGSCLFTILSVAAFPGSEGSRVAAQIVVGIGFIGAGTVLRTGGTEDPRQVRGLTTAAGLWATSAIGMAVATGFYWLALFSTILAYITLTVIKRVERIRYGGGSGNGDGSQNSPGPPLRRD
jgi:putative Mg2+ transporter-C (MgtC) family protein